MSWDPIWEQIFRGRDSWGYYPPEELIRFVAARYYKAVPRSSVSFLEIGCGPGAGPSWYLAREGFRYAGIDGSATAVERARARFAREGLDGAFEVGDFAKLPWPSGTFDCVIDVAALQCNDESSTAIILGEVHRVLKAGGRHFSLTAKGGSWGDGTGQRVDATTRREPTAGPYVGMGAIRFASAESLRDLYAAYGELEINYSVRSVADGAHEIGHWVVTCMR